MDASIVAAALAAGVLAFFLLGGLVQWLWNATVPELFGLPPLAYWQAVRLFLLVNLLTGGAGMAVTG